MAQTGGFFNGFSLPSVSAPTSFSPQSILKSYQASHDASRNANQQLAERISAGYDRVLASQQQDLAGVTRYGQKVSGDVMRGIRGANQANLRDIARRFTALSGDQAQDLIARGLGNSTIQSSVQRGLAHSYSDARTRSENDFSRLASEYRSQLGQFMTQQKMQEALSNSALAQQQLQWMNTIDIGYPDMGAFAQMASLAGSGSGMGGYGGGGGGVIYGDASRPIGGYNPMSGGSWGGGGFQGYGSGAGGLAGWAYPTATASSLPDPWGYSNASTVDPSVAGYYKDVYGNLTAGTGSGYQAPATGYGSYKGSGSLSGYYGRGEY